MTLAASGAAVTLRGVSVAYPGSDGSVVTAVHDADLSVAAGSIVALLGPSGCGKTSLLRAVAGLEVPSAGQIDIGGRIVSSQPEPGAGARRVWMQPELRDVGMVFQDGALFPHLTVTQNIVFGLRAKRKGLSRTELSTRVEELLDLVDLTGFGDRMPDTLSGGQQQRVALARSLAPQPKVLLLDEPFSALDAALRIQVRAEVARILRGVGVTTVFVTHDQDEAFVLGDQVAVMHDGHIEQFGSPDELYRSPQTPWVAGFVGEANFVAGTIASQITHASSDTTTTDAAATATTNPGTVDTAIAETPIGTIAIDDRRSDTSNDEVNVLVRPEQIALVPFTGEAATPGQHGVVTAVEYYGHDVRYELALDDGTILAARTHSTELYERGARVTPTFQSRERDSRSAAFSADDAPKHDARTRAIPMSDEQAPAVP